MITRNTAETPFRFIAVRLSILARLTFAVGLACFAVAVAGCDKAASKDSKAGAGMQVGVVDYDRVFAEMGWRGEVEKSLQATQSDLRNHLQTYATEVADAVARKRAQIAAAAKLDSKQIEDLNSNRDLDKLPLSPEQRVDLFSSLNNANALGQQAEAAARGIYQQRQGQLLGAYRDSLKPAVRRVAEANGLQVVITTVETVVYYNPAVDLTNKLIDDIRQNPPAHTLPEATPLDLPRVTLSGSPGPTTGAAAPATRSSTAGTRPSR